MVWDLFITHAWHYHEHWVRLSELLDAEPGLSWRNFSVSWHDPAMDPNTEVGGQFVRGWLQTQIYRFSASLCLRAYSTDVANVGSRSRLRSLVGTTNPSWYCQPTATRRSLSKLMALAGAVTPLGRTYDHCYRETPLKGRWTKKQCRRKTCGP